jgi:hypothetical protein
MTDPTVILAAIELATRVAWAVLICAALAVIVGVAIGRRAS